MKVTWSTKPELFLPERKSESLEIGGQAREGSHWEEEEQFGQLALPKVVGEVLLPVCANGRDVCVPPR